MPFSIAIANVLLTMMFSVAVLPVTHWPKSKVQAAAVRPFVFLVAEDGAELREESSSSQVPQTFPGLLLRSLN